MKYKITNKGFNPVEIIFAPTAQCNLFCKHCFVNRNRGLGKEKLTSDKAINFLETCKNTKIEKIGFSGGEPFLELDFLEKTIKAAVKLDFLFDRIMTNGLWWKTKAECEISLQKIYNAGFDGIIGLSIDKWHSENIKKLSDFIFLCYKVFNTNCILEITTVSNQKGKFDIKLLKNLSKELNAKLKTKYKKPNYIFSKNNFFIPIQTIKLSQKNNNWNVKKWFNDDFCEGPGHVFYVHPDNSVAVCCGFANEKDELIIGKITDGYTKLLENAKASHFVKTCYNTGLNNYRKSLENKGINFPGKTNDICFFCSYLCGNNLANK